MVEQKVKRSDLKRFFMDEDEDILNQVDQFARAVSRLNKSKNLKLVQVLAKLETQLDFFSSKMPWHLQTEEEVLYPFVAKRIPRLDAAIRLLIAEHTEMNENVHSMNTLYRKLVRQKDSKQYGEWLAQFGEIATYYLYLVRHHIHIERKVVFEAVANHLTETEREMLSEELRGLIDQRSFTF